jgi:hypothetical protein
MGVFERIKERLQHAEAFEEDDGHLLEDAATEIARLRTALEEITKCDDDGYGPAGYCAKIAQKALGAERAGDQQLLFHLESDNARLRAVLREIDAMIPQYIDFVQPKIREALANEQLTRGADGTD